MQAMALFGGTFDPVHYGHLRLAVEALERLPIEAVWFVPLYLPNHRRPPVAPAALRRRMLQAAIAGQPALKLDDRELERAGTSYTVETLESVRREQGARPIIWLMGMDAFAGLPHWHRWRELTDLAHLVVVSRPGTALPKAEALVRLLADHGTDDPGLLAAAPAGKLLMLPMPMLDISSSTIRECMAAGRSPRFLLPEPVISIIEAHALYQQRG